jgi:putative heme transporter
MGRWQWPQWLPPPKLVLVVLIVAAFGFLLYRIRSDLATAWHRASPAGLPWLVAAVGAEVVSFLCYAAVQRRLLVAGGARLQRRTVVKLTVAATGLTNLVPGGTAPASGWLVTQYRRHGVPLPLALWAVLAGGFVAGVSVLLLLLVGAAIAGLVGVWEFFGLLAVLGAAAVAGVAGAHHLPAVRAWLSRERRLPGIGALRRVVHQAGSVAQFRATVPGGLNVYVLSVANWSLDVIVLATGFLVVDLPVPWRALLFAYATAQVAGSLAPVPGGIGFVEGGMIGAFALAGTPTGDAVVATVIYRLITTLGIAGIGTVALFFVNRREPVPAVLSGDAAALAGSSGSDRGDGANQPQEGPVPGEGPESSDTGGR